MQILFHTKFAVIVPQDFWEEMSLFLYETMFKDYKALFSSMTYQNMQNIAELNIYINPPL